MFFTECYTTSLVWLNKVYWFSSVVVKCNAVISTGPVVDPPFSPPDPDRLRM